MRNALKYINYKYIHITNVVIISFYLLIFRYTEYVEESQLIQVKFDLCRIK